MNLQQWGYSDEPAPVSQRVLRKKFGPKAKRIDDEKAVAIYRDKGLLKSYEAAEKHDVHVTTINRIWRKAIHRALLETLDQPGQPEPPKKTGYGAKLPDDQVLRIYGRKGEATAEDVASDEGVHVSTVNAIWRKAVRKKLLEGLN